MKEEEKDLLIQQLQMELEERNLIETLKKPEVYRTQVIKLLWKIVENTDPERTENKENSKESKTTFNYSVGQPPKQEPIIEKVPQEIEEDDDDYEDDEELEEEDIEEEELDKNIPMLEPPIKKEFKPIPTEEIVSEEQKLRNRLKELEKKMKVKVK